MPTLYGKKVKILRHAKDRMASRKISIDDIKQALLNIKVTRKMKHETKPDSFLVRGKNNLEVILNNECTKIITLHWFNLQLLSSRKKEMKNKKRKQNIKKYGNRANR